MEFNFILISAIFFILNSKRSSTGLWIFDEIRYLRKIFFSFSYGLFLCGKSPPSLHWICSRIVYFYFDIYTRAFTILYSFSILLLLHYYWIVSMSKVVETSPKWRGGTPWEEATSRHDMYETNSIPPCAEVDTGQERLIFQI